LQDIDGTVAFVSGAASGIGLGMTRALVAAGASVMMADIEAPALAEAARKVRAAGGNVDTVHCDVSDRDSVFAAAQSTLAAFERVHVVCNNAGVSTGGLIEECDEGDWNWSIGVNYMGVVHGCQAFVPILKRQGEGGHIVNTASMAGLLGGMAGWGPYNSTKFAVVGLTEVLRQEGRSGGFGASVLCPGGVRTNINTAPRNRPGRFGEQRSKVTYEDISEGIEQGLDPDVVGRLVVQAILANRQYIFTDPRFRRLLEKRSARLLEDLDWSAGVLTS
jgi:NAD(P)-dependent dehydrogenase (short-subunit alcohol dehydrogenase family)